MVPKYLVLVDKPRNEADAGTAAEAALRRNLREVLLVSVFQRLRNNFPDTGRRFGRR